MIKDFTPAFKKFVETKIVLPKGFCKQDSFKTKIDLLERMVEATRIYEGYESNCFPLKEFVPLKWHLSKDFTITMIFSPQDPNEFVVVRYMKPETLQIPLLIYLLLNYKKDKLIYDIIKGLTEELGENLSIFDFEKTRIGVIRCFTNTRFAASVLRDYGLLKYTDNVRFKTWQPSFLGILVAAVLYQKNWREECQSHKSFRGSKMLSDELGKVVDFVCQPANFRASIRYICEDSKISVSVAEAITKALVDKVRLYNNTVFSSDLALREKKKNIGDIINELEGMKIVDEFMNKISFKYEMSDFNARMAYYFRGIK